MNKKLALILARPANLPIAAIVCTPITPPRFLREIRRWRFSGEDGEPPVVLEAGDIFNIPTGIFRGENMAPITG